MIQELPFVILIAGAVLVGLWMSNYLLDKGVPFVITRKAGGHIFGGIGYILCALLFSQPYWPIILSIAFTGILGVSHFLRPRDFRGVGGSSRPESLAEVLYPVSGSFCIVFGWLCLHNTWLAIVPCLYLAWGDSATGIVRFIHHRGQTAFKKYNCGTIAMLVVCLGIALLFRPYWIAACGAVTATIAEKLCGEQSLIHEDDNGIIPLATLFVMAPLWVLWG